MSPHSITDTSSMDGDESSGSYQNTYTNGNQNGATHDKGTTMETPKHETEGHKNQSRYVRRSESDLDYDLVCVGFGPASLAVAIALHDALEAGTLSQCPKVLFLEKQHRFAWHAGMLLPGAKMQISFIKDLASLRNPRSNFTFLNYLHQQGRLVDFTNLSTFLPARVEYEDYLRWCASFFDEVVQYGSEVLSVVRDDLVQDGTAVKTFRVASRDVNTGEIRTHRATNVILALGGQPSLPRSLPNGHPRVIHSSQYAHLIPKLLTDANAPYRVAVVGAGQSAAEIFSNIQTLYPNSTTKLVMRSEFLKPSDDSPFVNTIFNPEYIDALYPKPTKYRRALLADARATNYGVVRLELIERLYEVMYEQRRVLGSDESRWPHRILGGRRILKSEAQSNELQLHVQYAPLGLLEDNDTEDAHAATADEVIVADVVIAATGYQRHAHIDLLQDLWQLLPQKNNSGDALSHLDRWEVSAKDSTRIMEVTRDYKVNFEQGAVASGSGIWLQGCCEGSHGLSDTLLSVLATRSGEIVQSIFGNTSNNSY